MLPNVSSDSIAMHGDSSAKPPGLRQSATGFGFFFYFLVMNLLHYFLREVNDIYFWFVSV